MPEASHLKMEPQALKFFKYMVAIYLLSRTIIWISATRFMYLSGAGGQCAGLDGCLEVGSVVFRAAEFAAFERFSVEYRWRPQRTRLNLLKSLVRALRRSPSVWNIFLAFESYAPGRSCPSSSFSPLTHGFVEVRLQPQAEFFSMNP